MEFPKILLLSKKALNERPLYDWLEESSKSVILVTTEDAFKGLPNTVKTKFLATEIVDDYYSWEVELLAESLCRMHNIEYIVSSSEDDTIRAARIREHMGMSGQSMNSAMAYRDKLIMKQICSEAKINVPKFAPVDSLADLLSFVEKQRFPVVVKPRLSAGSVGVHILNNMCDLKKFIATGVLSVVPDSSGIWLVEEYIQAEFYHVDGLMEKGKILHCWPSQYSSGNLESARNSSPIYTMLIDEVDPAYTQLRTLAEQVIDAFPETSFPTSFHLEAWITDKGTIFCEVASRTSGGTVAQDYFEAFGIHLSKENIRGQARRTLTIIEQPDKPKHYVGSIMIPPANGKLIPPESNCPIPEAVVTYAFDKEESYSGVENAGESVVTITVSAQNACEVKKKLQESVAWWKGEARWII